MDRNIHTLYSKQKFYCFNMSSIPTSSSSSSTKNNHWKALQNRIAMLAATPLQAQSDLFQQDKHRSRLEFATRQITSGPQKACANCKRIREGVESLLQDDFKYRQFLGNLFKNDLLIQEVERVELVLSDCVRNSTMMSELLQVANCYKYLLSRLNDLHLQVEEKPTGFKFINNSYKDQKVIHLQSTIKEQKQKIAHLQQALAELQKQHQQYNTKAQKLNDIFEQTMNMMASKIDQNQKLRHQIKVNRL